MTSFPALDFPEYEIRIDYSEKRPRIFDRYRKQYVPLTPEEWVRQHVAYYLNETLGYPRGLTQTEVGIKRYGFNRRCDIVVYKSDMTPILVVECKAPEITLSDKTLQQVAQYNAVLQAPMMVISNGLDHYCLQLVDGQYSFLETIPPFEDNIDSGSK